MAQANGTITKLIITVEGELTDDITLDDVPVSGIMYVADSMNQPFPGLPVDLGGTDMSGLTAMLGNSAEDLYTLATTGLLP